MLSQVFELELVTVDFEPVFHLSTGVVAAWRLVRRAQTELLVGLPPSTVERLVALAAEEDRLACLERLWQKVSIERVARFSPQEPVWVPATTTALDVRWSAASLRQLARAHGCSTPLVVALDEAPGLARVAAEARMAGFTVAARGTTWRSARPHWRELSVVESLAGSTLERVLECRAHDARLLVTGVVRSDQIRLLRAAGVEYIAGPVVGRPRVAPRPDEVGWHLGAEVREVQRFGRRYEPDPSDLRSV